MTGLINFYANVGGKRHTNGSTQNSNRSVICVKLSQFFAQFHTVTQNVFTAIVWKYVEVASNIPTTSVTKVEQENEALKQKMARMEKERQDAIEAHKREVERLKAEVEKEKERLRNLPKLGPVGKTSLLKFKLRAK